MDRETVITHLMIISTWATFARESDLQILTEKHLEDIAKWADDAIELLKEQEAVEPVLDGFLHKRCPSCRALLNGKFCHECGKPVKCK